MRAALFTLAAGAVAVVAVPMPAAAATARVTITPGSADPDYATNITVSGSGFQSIAKGFGGIYVMFGTVDGTWRPSQGGESGVDYDYVHDEETKNNHGFLRFVAFPGSSTSAEANGGTIAADGTWRTTLVIPGATFPAAGRNGTVRQVDCRKVQCGVLTIGAHGVVNPDNETFTPVRFAVPSDAPAKTSSAPRTSASRSTPARPTTAAPTPSASSTAPTASLTPTTSTPSPTPDTLAASPVAEPVDDSGSTASGWVLATGGVLVVGGVAAWALRRRRLP